MIEPMTRATLLFQTSCQDIALRALGEAGVIMLDEPKEIHLEALGEQRRRAEALRNWLAGQPAEPYGEPELGKERFETIEALKSEQDRLTRQITHQRAQARRWTELGDFDSGILRHLRDAGWTLNLYELQSKEFEALGPRVFWFPLFERHHRWVVALVSKDPEPVEGLRRAEWPEHNPSELRAMAFANAQRLAQVQAELDFLLEDSAPLFAYLLKLENNRQFEEAQASLEDYGPLSYTCGYLPSKELDGLRQLVSERGMVLLEEPAEPGESDRVPTLLKQNQWSRLFNPVLKFIGVLPGYHEPDANGLFLIFFSLFFALLVGDAGYGLIMLVGTAGAQWKVKGGNRRIYGLFYLLGASTLVWGALTGLWFGMESALDWPLLSYLVVPQINAWAEDSGPFLIRLTFIIGLVQLSIAHLWRILRAGDLWTRLSEAGWLLLLFGLYQLALFFVLREPLSDLTVPVIGAALGLVLCFSEQKPQQSFAKGLLQGLANFPLNLLDAVGNFSDLVSYIRLFAVGLATKEMAVTFNHLALGVGFDSWLAGLGAVVVLLLGHWINLMLAGIAVMVHGIRLNFLEFSKHLSLEWTGRPFRPFKLQPETKGSYGTDQ
ncbi:MAG: hypothetical protein RRB13_14655 [bacterium]|nr:hypothetical protein [bacterium]